MQEVQYVARWLLLFYSIGSQYAVPICVLCNITDHATKTRVTAIPGNMPGEVRDRE